MGEPAKPKASPSGSETRKRQHGIRLRVSAEEKTDIEARAERAGLGVAGYLRALAFGKDTPQPRAARRPPVEKQELVRLSYELRQIGGNLNQIAHALNAEQGFNAPAFAEIYAEHLATLKAIRAALGAEPGA